VALSGFFDGILLHQILQWHHLVSLAPGPAWRDPRLQIAADGAFHALMYGLALIGLAKLWKDSNGRREHRALWRGLALGFGGWNLLDAVLFHWILEWHHVRLDTPAPFLWDIGWLVVFGIVPIVLALATPSSRQGLNRVSFVVIAAVTLCAGAWAARPSADTATMVLFRPDKTPAEVMTAISAVDGRLIAIDASGTLVAIRLPSRAAAWRLYGAGAWIVGSAGPAGCAAWSQPLT
jgi:uncharacterized membrane protein